MLQNTEKSNLSAEQTKGRSRATVDPHSGADRTTAVLQMQALVGNRAVSSAIQALALQRDVDGPEGSISANDSSRSGNNDAGSTSPAQVSPQPRVEVGSTHIGGMLANFPIWHLFLIFTDASGAKTGYRAGPGGQGGPPGNEYGTIVSTTGPFDSNFIDYPSLNTVTVAEGDAASGKGSTFTSELARIEGTATPYDPLGPNSNTAASTLLHRAGLPHNKPVTVAPGFDDPDL